MSLMGAMRVSASGMTAERYRMDVTAGNLANADSAASFPGEIPYCRQQVELAGDEDGVRILGSFDHPDGLQEVDRPGMPGSTPDGKLLMTKVNPVEEMVDMMGATRAYEANIQAFNAAKGMAKSALTIGKA